MSTKIKSNKSTKSSKSKTVPVNTDSDSDNESLSDENDTKNTKSLEVQNVQKIEDDSEEVDNDNISDSDTSSESEQESDNNKKMKEKKLKESFDDLWKEQEIEQETIKQLDKEIDEDKKKLKIKKKLRHDHERKRNLILKKIPKSHSDQVSKAHKDRPKKRTGNINGGFCKDAPVPEILIKFIGLEPGAIMKRPKVLSALNNKLISLGLKKGQNTILNKEAVNELKLDDSYVNRIIEFGQLQTFLKGFYTVKDESEKNLVSVC